MKNKFLLFALAAMPFIAAAQDNPSTTGIKLGISAGSNISFLRDDNGMDYDPWTGRTAGLTFELPINKRFAFNTGVYYEQRNYRTDLEMYSTDPFDPIAGTYMATLEYKNHFLTVPVTAKLFFSDENSFYILGGGFASMFLADKLVWNGRNSPSPDSIVKKANFGVTFGAGYRWSIDSQNELNFELRDNLGLTKSYKNTDGFKSNTVALIINYQLTL
ncbi:MAG: porin family protein [Bacteroidia bacterium]